MKITLIFFLEEKKWTFIYFTKHRRWNLLQTHLNVKFDKIMQHDQN